MAGLPDLTGVYKVEIATISLDCPAWMTRNPVVLLRAAPRRDTSIRLPQGGSLPQPQTYEAWNVSLRMVFIGDVDRNGTPALDPRVQLNANIAWFEANVVNATLVNNVLAIKVTPFGGSAKQGSCQILDFERGETETSDGLTTSKCVLRLKIFGGALT